MRIAHHLRAHQQGRRMIRVKRQRLIGSFQRGEVLAAAKAQAGYRNPQIGIIGRHSACFIEQAPRIGQLSLRGRPISIRKQRRKTGTVSHSGIRIRLSGRLAPAPSQEQREAKP
jgi:hypothetical protein